MTLFLRHDQKKECKESLRKISGFADPIWGFYVYGTYTRPQVQGDAGEGDVPGKLFKMNKSFRVQLPTGL